MKAGEERHQALLRADAEFDENAGLVRGEVGPTRYHTRLEPGAPVHPTRESMIYAAALLESDEPWRRDRAMAILDRLLPLQEKDPSRPTCGIWPWYFEESLDQMDPPDWNWADFLGVQLIRILLNERVPPSVRPSVQNALRLAAHSVRHRNVRLSYTNIAIMGTYVCMMAGRILADETLVSYGRGRLRDFVDFTRKAGGFPEYNSPTYTVVSLVELSRMLRDFSEEDDRRRVREIHDMAWREIALHWHAPSRQWAGPHSRSYSTLLLPETRGFIKRGLGEPVEAGGPPSLDWCGIPLACPDDLRPFFGDHRPRFQRAEVVSQGDPPLLGHTHAEPEFVLSSAERGTFWNQARSLVAYAAGAREPQALAVRFLHDGYDFCAANLLTRQLENRVLAAVCFASDGGDKHGELDRFTDGRVAGGDWRLRFEFINGHNPPPLELTSPWKIPFGDGATVTVHWLRGEWGEHPLRLEVAPQDQGFTVDVVLYHGERKTFQLHSVFPACLAFALEISACRAQASEGEIPECLAGLDFLRLNWPGGLILESPRFPLRENEILDFARLSKRRVAAGDDLPKNSHT